MMARYSRRIFHVLPFLTTLVLPWLATSCGEAPSVSPWGATSTSVVGGTTTSDWPAVGALVIDDGGGAWMEYCSATLIASQWVLTTASCVDPNGDGPQPNETRFFVGPDIAASGDTYILDSVTVHPDWDPLYTMNDIALVHLSQSVVGTAPIPWSTTAVSVSDTITWVGYGVVSIDTMGSGGGAGVKRTAAGIISTVTATTYSYDANASSQIPCFGDAGGPDLVGAPGSETIAGLGSTGDGSCALFGTSTRVDAYGSWIAAVLAGITPCVCDTGTGCQADCACDPDCTGACPDADGDGYPSDSCGGTDCDDTDASVHIDCSDTPKASEDEGGCRATPRVGIVALVLPALLVRLRRRRASGR